MFSKLLIANRGEIALRVARTAKRMGISVVAVYSDADRNAPHVKEADEAVHIGPAPAAESYLRADRIIDAAKRTGAQAIHPGYGFLSENADFADACAAAGIIFVGPSPETIRKMGSKSAAKDIMQAAGVPTLPGYQGADQSVAKFLAEAKRIGYPVLLKAAAGGGGKGMRLVTRAKDLPEALASAQREAKSSFGDDRFLVEKYLTRPRHVEVQVFGDRFGNIVHMFERDCSIQRRHQKIIEEAPAPNLADPVRARLLEAGVAAARAADYIGAGTVEFLYDGAENVFFMEMNTRLQVEHPVTEEITGLDLVEWQLRVAAGEPLPRTQDQIMAAGHAVEARLYAERPDRDFTPSIGHLAVVDFPASARVDTGIEQGQDITPYYDPMIAKVITAGKDRNEAVGLLQAALCQTRILGPETNIPFLYGVVCHAEFVAGNLSTRFIEEQASDLFGKKAVPPAALAAACLAIRRGRHPAWESAGAPAPQGWRLNLPSEELYWIEQDGIPALMHLSRTPEGFSLDIEPTAGAAERRAGKSSDGTTNIRFAGGKSEYGGFWITINGHLSRFTSALAEVKLRIWQNADYWDFPLPDPLLSQSDHHTAEGSLVAVMPGVITQLTKAPGDKVAAGATLLVLEAMKMEHAVKAPEDGILQAHRFAVGDQVKEGDLLVDFTPEDH